jgi:hypothetical protein
MGIRLRSNGDSLAGGTPAFGGPAPAQELLDMRRRERSQNVLLRYQVLR